MSTCTCSKYFIIHSLAVLFFNLLVLNQTSFAEDTTKNISVDFNNTEISQAVTTILELSNSNAKVFVDKGISLKITKKVSNVKWDHVLKELLQENALQLVKRSDSYLIVMRVENQDLFSTNQYPPNEIANQLPDDSSQPKLNCTDDNLITLGYKHSAGLNPYALVGKCIKLNGVKPIQYFSATQALVLWRYRDSEGIVYVEDLSDNHKLGTSKFLTTKAVGVHEYVNTLGAKEIVPSLVIPMESPSN